MILPKMYRIRQKIDPPVVPDVAAAVRDAIQRGAIGFDAVKHLVLCRIERRPPRLDMTVYPYLPKASVTTTSAPFSMAEPSSLRAPQLDAEGRAHIVLDAPGDVVLALTRHDDRGGLPIHHKRRRKTGVLERIDGPDGLPDDGGAGNEHGEDYGEASHGEASSSGVLCESVRGVWCGNLPGRASEAP